jgi:hypothetical protein
VARRGFHIALAFILLACVVCPYIEFAIHFDQNIFATGYDSESTLAVIALLVILAVALARLLAFFLQPVLREDTSLALPSFLQHQRYFVVVDAEASPPLALRI